MGAELPKLRSLKSTPVLAPMARPLGASAKSIDTAPLLLVDIETDEGVIVIAVRPPRPLWPCQSF